MDHYFQRIELRKKGLHLKLKKKKAVHIILGMAAKNFTPTSFLSHLFIYIYTDR